MVRNLPPPEKFDYKHSSISRRLAALTIDAIIFIPVFIAMDMAAQAFGIAAGEYNYYIKMEFRIIATIVSIMLWIAYFALFEGTTGQTIGKMICGIKVVMEDGSPYRMEDAFIRNLLRIIDGLGVGAFFVIRSPKKQRLGDKVTETIVVKK
ncbi:MAG: RDD family protein [Deltaproteobacteria bacterium]|nr:RDD family protein [Deltaproteobacteria bacterium]